MHDVEMRSIYEPEDVFTRKGAISPPGLSLFSVGEWSSHYPWKVQCRRTGLAVVISAGLWQVTCCEVYYEILFIFTVSFIFSF